MSSLFNQLHFTVCPLWSLKAVSQGRDHRVGLSCAVGWVVRRGGHNPHGSGSAHNAVYFYIYFDRFLANDSKVSCSTKISVTCHLSNRRKVSSQGDNFFSKFIPRSHMY